MGRDDPGSFANTSTRGSSASAPASAAARNKVSFGVPSAPLTERVTGSGEVPSADGRRTLRNSFAREALAAGSTATSLPPRIRRQLPLRTSGSASGLRRLTTTIRVRREHRPSQRVERSDQGPGGYGRTCSGHRRLLFTACYEDVDAWNKSGHDERGCQIPQLGTAYAAESMNPSKNPPSAS